MSQVVHPILIQNPDINPYLYAAYEVWNRLKWYFNPKSCLYRRTLNSLTDKYNAQKVIIACNIYRSLKSNLSLLNNTFAFGLNKIYLLFDESEFIP
ncbi:MAG: hypothetical protein O9329_25650 [Microcystis sp. LE19-12.2C]|jgi:hypothetical protein|uniref:Uncharacterized protein n=1 Tax=Microcystis aeruginosa Ma_OC_H_19870700_S124 TaxID=2486262 RepID=A0A552A7J0_MICAE|nr:hypothetical protein [Microcystis sp. LE19-12.2C]TRT81428.1 MAG: hypothetical protein EWV63_22060 [Microcystis aeruginosa Ma_OC_H_19870700_S124]